MLAITSIQVSHISVAFPVHFDDNLNVCLSTDYIKFESKRINPDQLYKYIINHNKLYGLDRFQMNNVAVLESARIQHPELVCLPLNVW